LIGVYSFLDFAFAESAFGSGALILNQLLIQRINYGDVLIVGHRPQQDMWSKTTNENWSNATKN